MLINLDKIELSPRSNQCQLSCPLTGKMFTWNQYDEACEHVMFAAYDNLKEKVSRVASENSISLKILFEGQEINLFKPFEELSNDDDENSQINIDTMVDFLIMLAIHKSVDHNRFGIQILELN